MIERMNMKEFLKGTRNHYTVRVYISGEEHAAFEGTYKELKASKFFKANAGEIVTSWDVTPMADNTLDIAFDIEKENFIPYKNIKEHILDNWRRYNVVDSKEEMVALLNILEAHDEDLDTMHDVYMGNTDTCCGIWFNFGVKNDRETVRSIFENNIFYSSYDAMMQCYKEDANFLEITVEQIIEWENYKKTSDGYVRFVAC